MWVDSLYLAVKNCPLTLPLCLIQHVFIVDELTREREIGWMGGGPRAIPPTTRLAGEQEEIVKTLVVGTGPSPIRIISSSSFGRERGRAGVYPRNIGRRAIPMP
jgi:hypothetical protein